jgi:hypothetical protein
MDEQPDPPPPLDGDADEQDRPPRRLSPLTLALLLPALGVALVAALWAGSHARGEPTATTGPRPTAGATPGPTPWPPAWLDEDGGSVDQPNAYGSLAIAVPSTPPPAYTATLDPGATVPSPGRPDARHATVQRIRPLDPQTVAAIAVRLGALAPPQQQGAVTVWGDTDLRYDAAGSTFTWQPNSSDGRLPFDPRDTDGAASAARQWLLQRGLVESLAPVVATQVSDGNQAAFATWDITVPHLAGQSLVTEITMGVSASGLIGSVTIAHPVVMGAASYPIVDWEKAWAEVRKGRSRDVVVQGAAAAAYDLHVDRVQVAARLVHTPQGDYVIPAYGFTDSAARVTVYWPALDPSQYTLP